MKVIRAAGGVTQATLDAASAALVTLSPATTARNVIQPSADVIPLTIRGKAGQTAALTRWEDSAGGALMQFGSNGSASIAGSLSVPTTFVGTVRDSFAIGAYLDLSSLTEARFIGLQNAITVAVIGAPGQTADLHQWRVDGGAAVASVTITGRHRFVAANEQTTVGAAGGASVQPVTPYKYLKFVDSAGTVLAVPAHLAA